MADKLVQIFPMGIILGVEPQLTIITLLHSLINNELMEWLI